MPLDKPGLKAAIRVITDALYDNVDQLTPEECREKFATDLSEAIDFYVRTGLVITTGNSVAQSGVIT